MGEIRRFWPLALVTLAVLAIVSACRALGFGEGVILGATPASGLALTAALFWRAPGALAAGLGFAFADLAWGLAPAASATDAGGHALAALVGAHLMRILARRTRPLSKTREWRIFLAGVCAFAAVVAGTLFAGEQTGLAAFPAVPPAAPLLALAFEPLGIFTFCSMLLTVREYRTVIADLGMAVRSAALAIFLLGVLAILLRVRPEHVSPAGVTLALSVPFCLWIAMQARSFDGGVISFTAAHVGLLMILRESGSVAHPDYVTTMIYLTLLIANCQLVHAVNLDRHRARAEVEAQQRELEARVAERTAGLSAMTERALAADRAKSKFVATVSHEVRTPLNGVIGMASVVLARDLDPRTRESVELIQSSGLHLLEVINRILDFSRLGHEPAPSELVAFDLRALVTEVVEEARYAPHAQGIELRVELDPGLRTRRIGHRQDLRQVLTNLVGNGAKFTDAGSVTVRVRAGAGSAVRIEVQDTGIGIAPGMQQRIFQPFEQADAARTRRGGTGLGLAISAEMVERMGGRIGVVSAEGAGAVFWIELPLALAAAPARAARA